jgi:hypothetical protein
LARAISSKAVGSFFKLLDRAFGLRVMTWTRRQFAIPHRTQLATQRLLGHADLELVPQPLAEIDDPPPHDAVDRRNWPALDQLCKRCAMRVTEPRRLSRRFTVDQPFRAVGVELQHPVANDLQCHAADLGRLRARRSVVDRSQREQAAYLVGVLALARQLPQARRVKVGP